MPGGEVGIAYTATLTATGGATPYNWSIDSGVLPPGLTLGADGSVSGVPSAAGTFTVSVKATDSDNQYTTQGATIKIAAALAASLVPVCAQACRVEQGCTVCGTFGQQSGGVGPFSYSATGNIPGGMKLNGLSLAGNFPSVAQFWQVNVTVTDALGATASLAPTFYVWAHIKMGASKMSCGYPVNPCVAQFPYSGGTPGGGVSASVKISAYSQTCVTPAPNCPPPPDVVSAKVGSGVVQITVVLGTPNPAWMSNGWSGTLSVILTDSSPCGPGNCNTGAVPVSISVGAG